MNEIDDHVEIILAADGNTSICLVFKSTIYFFFYNLVIYDDDLTDVLFNVLTKCFQEKLNLHSIYITIEKRINFYADTLTVQCPAYEYFLEKMNELTRLFPLLVFEEIRTDSTSIKQCTTIYQRTNELVNKIYSFNFIMPIFILGFLAYLSF